MRVIVLGHVCIDHNLTEHAEYTSAGSPAMFISKIFKNLPDVDLTIVARYGEDFVQYTEGVHFVPRKPLNIRTLVYQNTVKNSVRIQKAFHRATALPVEMNNTVRSLIKSADLIVVAPLLPNFTERYIKQVKRNANPQSVRVLLPQGYFREFDEEHIVKQCQFREEDQILRHFNFVILSDEDHPQAVSLAKRLVKKNVTTLITKGAEGVDIYSKKNIQRVATNPVHTEQVVDSVGSGDIFSAGFIWKYFQNEDIIEACKFANSIARKCLFFTPDQIEHAKLL